MTAESAHSGAMPRTGRGLSLADVTAQGMTVTLRTPRLRDAAKWHKARLTDQAAIEQYWPRSDVSWQVRHRRRAWVREWLAGRRRLRRGTCVHTVIDVDGEFAGQLDIWLEPYHRRGEAGIWVHSRWAGTEVSTTAGRLMLGYLFDELGLERLSAPTSVGNAGAAKLVKRLGFQHEGVLRSYLEIADGRSDHDLWSFTRTDWLKRQET